MRQSEKHIKEILGQEIPLPDLVENRLQDTYKLLREKQTYRKKNTKAAAAAIAVLCLALPGAAYASSRTGFFQAMFGNATKASHEAIHKEIDNGKGGKTAVTIPSKEYVPVDEGKAEEAIGEWVMDEPIEKKIGSHTLRIESFAYDKNGALMYFTLEREGGVTALLGNEDTNLSKGAYFTDESDFYFICETEQEVLGFGNMYIDTERSTADKLYCYDYILWTDPLADGDMPQLRLDTYPCPRKEETEDTPVTTEKIPLTDKGPIPVHTIDLGENGYLEYSPISLSVDMSKGFGLSLIEAQDPYHMGYMEISYGDGSSYVIHDKENDIDNSSYTLGTETYYKTMFNRLVDTDAVTGITVNGVQFAP